MLKWNFADVWETVAECIPDARAQSHGDRVLSWRETEARASGVGATLRGVLDHQSKVAIYLYNCPEYMETAFGCLKGSLVPVNTNYRYGVEELRYIWNDADAQAVVFHGAFTPIADQVRSGEHDIRLWIHVDDGTVPCPDWAVSYEDATLQRSSHHYVSQRSGDDMILIYTGGTTGRPKGVMWRQHDLYRVSDTAHDPAEMDLGVVCDRILRKPSRPVGVSAAPLMHGTGYVFSGTILSRGGELVVLDNRRFDPIELLDTVSTRRATALCIVGEAFGRPIVEALDAEPDRWDLSTLEAVSSAGMVWRAESKQRLLRHVPNAILVDLLNSSEASGIGRSITSASGAAGTGEFKLGRHTTVVGPDGEIVKPGSGVQGRLAVSGHLPLGYYKDPEKTAQTFQQIDGVRYSFPGDIATVEPDGTIRLLGRSSGVINTGGEKVFPEEVEDVLRDDPFVVDVIVVGIPDERMGEVVAGIVQLVDGQDPDISAILTRAKDRLARYKIPRLLIPVESVFRAPSGKADYMAVRRRIQEDLERSNDSTYP